MSTQDKFQEALHNYRAVIDSLVSPVIIIDLERKIRFMNTAAKQLFPGSYGALLNQSCSVLNTENCKTANCCVERFLRNETGAVQYGYNGAANRVDVSYLRDSQGNPVGYINVSTDIRELIDTQRQLKISQRLYEIALQQTRGAILEYDLRNDTLKRLDKQEDIFSSVITKNEILENIPDVLIDRHLVLSDSTEELYRVCKELKKGVQETSCQLHFQLTAGDDFWLSITCTTIFDENHKPLKAICISKDITEQKKLEDLYERERDYREVLSLGYISVFEVNLTQDRIIHINEEWRDSIHLYKSNTRYQDLLHALLELVKPLHRSLVSKSMSYEYLLEKYNKDIRQISIEYEKKIDETYHWVNATIHLLKKADSDDLYACVYLKNIDKEKKKEEKLKNEIEIDSLTNTMNRRGFIIHADHRLQIHTSFLSALMTIDIDNFKEVNDTFGHLYGDAVLSETAKKIARVCRDDTLIGRLGGDEFVILFSHLKDAQDIEVIANRLRNALETEYTSGNYTVKTSISIGIALHPDHGMSFMELYEKADIALYHCKNNGRNQWALYHDDMKRYMQIMENLNREDEEESSINKPFEGNIGEYVFRILYRKIDQNQSLIIASVLELLARHFDMQLSYVLDCNHKQGTVEILHHWEESPSGKLVEIIGDIDPTELNDYMATMKRQEDNIVFKENTDYDDKSHLNYLIRKLKVQSFAQMCSSLTEDQDILIGLSSFKHHTFTRQQRNDLKTVFEVIATFLRDQRQQQLQKQHIQTLISILDSLDYAVYVIDPKTHKLIYFNQDLQQIFPHVQTNKICYQCFRSRNIPCEDCPIGSCKDFDKVNKTVEIYNELKQVWIKTSAISISWLNGEQYVLISCVDITEYKSHYR